MKKVKRIMVSVLSLMLILTSFASAQTVTSAPTEVVTKEGLTATELLLLVDSKLKEEPTYKFRGKMDMLTTVKLPTGEEQTEAIKTEQEGAFAAPETVYTISKAMANINGEDVEQITEVYMKDRTMYMRMGPDQDWIKLDLNPLMGQLESLMGDTQQQGVPHLTGQQLEAFGMYASYGQDVTLDGQEYYVINIDIDPEAFKEMYQQIMDQTLDLIFQDEMWETMKKEQGIPEVMDEETFKAMIRSTVEQMLQNMDVQMTQEYYIHKENKIYGRLKITQQVTMNLMGLETKVDAAGEFEYYGFGEEITFPEIPEEVEDLLEGLVEVEEAVKVNQ